MKITNNQLKRLIREFYSADVEEFLRANAEEYRLDPNLDSRAIRMLLMDDFMDNVGYSEDISEYQDLIDSLSSKPIKEIALEKGRDFDSSDGEGKMTRSQLFHVAEYAAILYEMIQDEDDLPEWVQSKISVMANDIGKIKHYLEYKILRMEG